MPPKREPQPIEAKFLFNRQIGWMPSPLADSPQPSASRSPAKNEELKEQFAAFVQGEIVATTNNRSQYGSTIPRADRVKILSGIRAVALDPLSELDGLDMAMIRASSKPLDKYFKSLLTNCFTQALVIIGIWVNKPVETLDAVFKGEGSEQAPTKGKAADRSNLDKIAQRIVPPWYQNCCTLTGVETVDAAHIVDVQATKSMDEPVHFWDMLRMFWPLEDIQQLEITGHEKRNILPMQPTAHRLWDRHKFALCPIPHPTDPEHSMYLQVVWFEDRHAEIGLADNGRSKETNLSDRRRTMEDSIGAGARYVMHGDIYELSTSDPEKRPLPNIYLFQIRYAIQQLFAGQQAAGALQAIFGGDPPDDPGTVRDEAFMPSDWDGMLRDALELGILSTTTEAIWRRCILENAYEQSLQKVRRYREWKAELAEAEEEGEDGGEEEEEKEEVQEEKDN
ncbi:hypothetical protein B0T14DRAFT_604884 [Immersiella caudata]|uniref:HNH nuclease domain-containing protein n=1 Tax=Immersiella caudata TaxID=314043 RepID=A0AA40BWU9_9PEZI|nr:hypothetical protein B0T14DRAFT_604884 [Immersiella caudata]